MAPSYQLPDLLNLCRPFELRTNRSCRVVTLASEAWLIQLKKSDHLSVLTESEQSSLPATKIGLLAALCFPTCDGAPLRLITDLLNFLVLANERIRFADISQSGWRVANRENGLARLGDHELFRLVPQIVRLSAKAPPPWDTQFTNSVNSYCDAQLQFMNNRWNGVIPDINEYLTSRRDLCGFAMVLDLLELTESMTFPSMDDYLREKLMHLRRLALDIVCCSLDVVSYNRDQAQGIRYNLVTVFMTQKALSIQGALNLAGVYIKNLVDMFVATERVLLDARVPTPPRPNQSRSMFLYLQDWSWFPLSRILAPSLSETPQHERGDTFLCDIPSYIQALRDCVVGTINWAYETELYFGKKGEEVRSFGWIFLNQKLKTGGEEPEPP